MHKTPGPKNSNDKRSVSRSKVILAPKLPKKGTASSQSRDTREDRGARQMKTKHSSQTFPHGH